MKERPILFSGPMVRAILEGRKSQTRRIVKPQPQPHGGAGLAPIKPYHTSLGDWAWVLADTGHGSGTTFKCPHGQTGDLLWVRETFTYWERPDPKIDITPRANESSRPADGKRYQRWLARTMPSADEGAGEDFLVYKADDFKRSLGEWKHPHPIYEHCVGRFGKTLPAIFMPRWASRLTLRITGVRVERLQEISEADSLAEGCRAVEAEPWWQGYKECEGELMHQQARGRVPPDWMIEPKPSYNPTFDPLACTAKQAYESLWNSINGKRAPWSSNPWVWVIEFERIEQQARVP